METMTASEMWDIMEELGIAVDKSFIEPCDLTPPTLEELCSRPLECAFTPNNQHINI